MKRRIAILGSGPMGLAAAYQLVQDGYQPVIFEADDRIGGMSASFDFDGMEIERYYHFHCTSDQGFLNLLKELGIADKMRWKETKMGYYYQGKVLPWGNPIALLQFPGLSFLSKIRYGLHAFLSTKRTNWKVSDNINAIDWIKQCVGEEAYKILWRQLFDLKFYHYANNLSAAWIWSRIRRIGRSRYNIFKEKLGHLEGGSNTLLLAMQDYIKRKGGAFHLSSPVTRVIIEKNKVKGLEVRGDFLPFDKIISTIPLPYVPQIIPDLPENILQQYKSINNIAVVCIIVKLKKQVTPNFWLNINDENMDIPGMVEYTHLRKMDHSVVYVPFYMPGEHPKYQESNQQFLEKVKQYIKKINPDISDSDIIAMHASRYRYAQPICTRQFLKKIPPVALPITGLFVADTSYYYPEDRGISESIDFGRAMAKQAI